jgi:hypothetical protein
MGIFIICIFFLYCYKTMIKAGALSSRNSEMHKYILLAYEASSWYLSFTYHQTSRGEIFRIGRDSRSLKIIRWQIWLALESNTLLLQASFVNYSRELQNKKSWSPCSCVSSDFECEDFWNYYLSYVKIWVVQVNFMLSLSWRVFCGYFFWNLLV